jgi:SHS2 domain-containing protein
MTKTVERLEHLMAKLRRLPEVEQERAADLLADLTDEVYLLSDAEDAAIDEAMDQARQGGFISPQAADAILRKAWR